MRVFVLTALSGATLAACLIVACSSDPSGGGTPMDPTEGGATADGPNAADTSIGPADGGRDAAKKDGDTDTDGAIPDDGGKIDGGDPPGVQLIGRFENDGTGDNIAFPGSKIIARFNGANAVVKLSQTDGFNVGEHTWMNVVVDGVLQPKIEIFGASRSYTVAQGLAAGAHTVELEKRTEGNIGVIRYEGFTFPNGGVLLGPPARAGRRLEFLSDSTVDGFGIEGNRNTTCGVGLAPPQFNNSRKSMSALTAAALSAETFLIGYSGKGLTKNGAESDKLLFPTLYNRSLPDSAGSVYGFALKPDAVIISLGGVDFDGLTAEPAGFSASYGGLVDNIRTRYPSAWIFLTVWSQIKDDNILTRTAMKNSLAGIITAKADPKISYFQFPEAMVEVDETGCQYHGNEAHHASMATLLTAEIKAKLGW